MSRGEGVKISYDIFNPELSWDTFWLCQNKSILTIQEIIDIIFHNDRSYQVNIECKQNFVIGH